MFCGYVPVAVRETQYEMSDHLVPTYTNSVDLQTVFKDPTNKVIPNCDVEL